MKGALNLGVASTLSAIFSRARLRHFETDKKIHTAFVTRNESYE